LKNTQRTQQHNNTQQQKQNDKTQQHKQNNKTLTATQRTTKNKTTKTTTGKATTTTKTTKTTKTTQNNKKTTTQKTTTKTTKNNKKTTTKNKTTTDKMRALVTGAGGFMGSHLMDYLGARNVDVVGTIHTPTVDLSRSTHELIECDIRDSLKVKEVIDMVKPHQIYHLAAQSFPTVSWKRPVYTVQTNVIGTINLFEAIKDLSPGPQVLVACSSAEYGVVPAEEMPIKETRSLLPLHPYGVSKVAEDLLAYQYHQNFGVNAVRVRIFNTTGPKKIGDVCSDFTKQIAAIELGIQEPILRVGNVETKRAIIDVRDIIEAFWLSLEKGTPGEVYNISGERTYLIKDILAILLKLTKHDIRIKQDQSLMRPSDEAIIIGDSTKFKVATGWKQTIPLEETLKDMVEWWKQKLIADDPELRMKLRG